MSVALRAQLMSTIAGAWLLAPGADFWEVEPNSLILFACVGLALSSLFLCGLGLANAASRLRLSVTRVGIFATGELLVLSIMEIAGVRLLWGTDTFKYLLSRQTVGCVCAILIVMFSIGVFLRRRRSEQRENEERQPSSRPLAAFTTLTGLIVSVAIAYGFAQFRTYAPNDAMFRTARAAESVFILGLPALLLTVLVVDTISLRYYKACC
jgi:hypothetical protein